MKTITLTQLRSMSVKALTEAMPITVLASKSHGAVEPIFIIGKPDEIIALSDLHPIIQTQLKNIELRARSGMPLPEKIEGKEVGSKQEPDAPPPEAPPEALVEAKEPEELVPEEPVKAEAE